MIPSIDVNKIIFTRTLYILDELKIVRWPSDTWVSPCLRGEDEVLVRDVSTARVRRLIRLVPAVVPPWEVLGRRPLLGRLGSSKLFS